MVRFSWHQLDRRHAGGKIALQGDVECLVLRACAVIGEVVRLIDQRIEIDDSREKRPIDPKTKIVDPDVFECETSHTLWPKRPIFKLGQNLGTL